MYKRQVLYDGTLDGVSSATGIVGKAMSFDGSDDHIDTTDYALYSMATTGSLSFWINPATAHNNDIIIDNTDASSGNNGFMVRFEDPTGNQAKMKFAIWGPTDSWVLTDEIFTENEWQHVAIVYDGSTGKIYRNGVESVTSSSSSGAMAQNTNTPTYQTRIGEASNDNDTPYHGLMDEVYHFADKALTPTNTRIRRQTPYGASYVKPLPFDGGTIYVQNTGTSVREFVFTDEESAYTSTPLSLISSHLISSPTHITTSKGAFSRPEQYAFIVNDDGTLAIFHSIRSEKKAGWVKWTTTGHYHSVCAIDDRVFTCLLYTSPSPRD